MESFPVGSVSLSDMKSMNDKTFSQLIKAANLHSERQEIDAKREKITINVSVPHEKYSFTLKVPVGGTFHTVSAEQTLLRQYLECVCGGLSACSTCHVIVDPKQFPLLPPAEESEMDMLDIAAQVTETSRLGCQIVFTPSLDGLRVEVPREFNNVFGTVTGSM